MSQTDKPVYKEMLSFREYRVGKITVTVKIDRRAKTASLVEWYDGPKQYEPKQWVFADRTADYVATWLKIMGAMSYAMQCALDELKQYEQEDLQKSAELMMAISDDKPVCPGCTDPGCAASGQHIRKPQP